MENSEALSAFFTAQQPLGPISADDYEATTKKEVFEALFDTDNLPFRSLGRNPTMIVGRKGAGKTDVLLSYKYETSKLSGSGYDPVIYFAHKDAGMFITAVVGQVADAVNQNLPSPMVENIADFWDGLFWICLFAEIARDGHDGVSPEKKIICDYVAQYGIDEHHSANPYRAILQAMTVLKRAYEFSPERQSGFDFFSSLPALRLGNIMLEDARLAALNWLRSERKHAIILFDSVEAMDLRDTMKSLVISALLKSIGSFEKPGIPVSFRCCIPSESYYLLSELSSNTLKDFQRTVRLQWSAVELLRLAAKRYATYLELYTDGGASYTRRFDLSKRSDVIRFWENNLPQFVPNTRTDQQEPTISYILRHTQLLPRQSLLLLNEICAAAIESAGRQSDRPQIDASLVVSRVRACEPRIVDQILTSYSTIWPDAGQILESVLPTVGENIVAYSDLHAVFNRRGIEGRMGVDNFLDFLRMLSQLGAVGRLTKSHGTYVTALFEYSEPSKMIYRPGDSICFHPVFTDKYRIISADKLPDTYKPVYPLGTDIDSEDRRLSQSSL